MLKYFLAASLSWRERLPKIAGIKAKRFSSNPIQVGSQSMDIRAIVVPIIATIIKLAMFGLCVSIKLRQELNLPKFN